MATKILPMLALVGPLMACSTAAQQQAVAIQNGLQSAVGQGKACEQQLQNRPEFAPIRPHMTLETAADLADTSLPTPAEAELIKSYMTGYAECQSVFRAQVAATEPAAAQALDQLIFDVNSLAADLITRKITWADAARRWHDIKSQDGAAVRAAHGAVMGTLAAQHRQEVAERRERFAEVQARLRAIGGVLLDYANATRNIPSGSEAPMPAPLAAAPIMQPVRPAPGPTHCTGHLDLFGNVQSYCY
jgi:hypothetical protein